MLKTKFKVGDRIMYRGYQYEITGVKDNYYDVKAIPPYDYCDGVVVSIGPGGEGGITLVPKNHQMTVGELIYELQKFNQEAKVCIGDNFNNRVSIGWANISEFANYTDSRTDKKGAEYVCLDIAGNEEKER